MTKTLLTFVAIVAFGSLYNLTAFAKPDNVDGFNVPEGRLPQKIIDNRYPRTYFPGTEQLGKDEMRITALGTGMPR